MNAYYYMVPELTGYILSVVGCIPRYVHAICDISITSFPASNKTVQDSSTWCTPSVR